MNASIADRAGRAIAAFSCAVLVGVTGCSLLLPPGARAAGLSLGWQDCSSGGGPGFHNQNYGCTVNSMEIPLYPTFVLAAGVDSVFAMELVIDVDVAEDPLPAWWHMEPGGCRAAGWAADATSSSSCADPWAGTGVASAQGWLVGTPGGSGRHGRLLVAAQAAPQSLVTLDPDVAYTACRVLLRSNNTLTCVGCTTPACLVFNSLLIRRLPGSSVEELLVDSGASQGANWVNWQAGTAADCQAVPVRSNTWAAVKALYR